MAIVLNIIDSAGHVFSLPLTEEEFSIGRSSKCNLKIEDIKCSGIHCSAKLVDGKAVIKDLDSSNGTMINSSIIDSETFIYLEDKVKIGNTVFFLDAEKMTLEEKALHTQDSKKKQSIKIPSNEDKTESTYNIEEFQKKVDLSRVWVKRKHLKKHVPEKLEIKTSVKNKRRREIQKKLKEEMQRKEPTSLLKNLLKKLKR